MTSFINRLLVPGIIFSSFLFQGCTGVNTFPTIARPGDTVSIMVGGTEKARKNTIAVSLSDGVGGVHDLQALGLVRSVFNLRADGRASGMHYSSYLDSYFPWAIGHEPTQTVLVADIPANAAPGIATLTVNTFVDDDSSSISDPFTVNMEILDSPGGTTDQFLRQVDLGGFIVPFPAAFSQLEPAPHAKVTFNGGAQVIGAASLVVDFDEAVVNPGDLNIYVPESTVRVTSEDFGATQRMVYWRQDGLQLYVDIIAPQGIEARYLQFYVMHPNGLPGSVNFSLASNTVYDVDGTVITAPAVLEYFP